jgi:4-hydroxy-tetrahydrodipicolinate synthase
LSTMDRPLFQGVGVALVTLFHEDGSLAAQATADLAGRLVRLGVAAVVVAGSTGEAAALDPPERVELITAVRKEVAAAGGVPVIAGTGAPSARQAAVLTAQACDAGADGVLVLSPPGSRDLPAYYSKVREAAGSTPVLAYHFPNVSSPGIHLDLLPALPVDGCKDSSGDPARMLLTLEAFDRPLYVGSAALLALAGPLGCTGAILALANAAPELCAAAFAGERDAQRAIAGPHRRATDSFPMGIKELTSERFGTSTAARLG